MEMLLEQLDAEYGGKGPAQDVKRRKKTDSTGTNMEKKLNQNQTQSDNKTTKSIVDMEDTGEPLSAPAQQPEEHGSSTMTGSSEATVRAILERFWKDVSTKTKFTELYNRLQKPWQLDNAQKLAIPSTTARKLESLKKLHRPQNAKSIVTQLRQSPLPRDTIIALHQSWTAYASSVIEHVLRKASALPEGGAKKGLPQNIKDRLLADVALRIDLSFAKVSIRECSGAPSHEGKSGYIVLETTESLILVLDPHGKTVMLLKRSLEKVELELPKYATLMLTKDRFWENRKLARSSELKVK